jgi:geranylgeranyl reductase family protein
MTSEHDVIVVGGGPAGAATALFLRQRGHDVVLLDEAHFPRDKVCGEGISPGAWELLEELGAGPKVRALAPHPLRGMALVSPEGAVVRGDYEGAHAGFAVRRDAFDAALLGVARDSDVRVLEGQRVIDIERVGERVTGVVTAEGRLKARLVVGADGRRSIVARRLGLLREHARLRKWAVRGHFEGMQGLEERGEMHVGGGGYCGIAPLSRTRANVTFVLDKGEMRGGDLESFYHERLRAWPRIAERLEKASLLAPPKAIGPLALVASRVSFPGGLLVGDAAGFYDPFTGEGVTLALRSAALAARVAHEALGSRAPLSDYDALRDAATRHKFRLNRLIQQIVASPGLANFVGRRLLRRPSLAHQLVSIAGDLAPAKSAFSWAFLRDFLAA